MNANLLLLLAQAGGAGEEVARNFVRLVLIAVPIVIIVGMWKVFTKAGHPGWGCLIPIYSPVVLRGQKGDILLYVKSRMSPFLLPARQLRPLLAAPRERRPEHLRDRDAEEGGRHVGPIVDVLLEGASLASGTPPTAHEPDRIDLEEQSGSAAVGLGLRVEDVRLPESEVERVRTERALVQ